MKHFLANKGLSMTQAQTISNLCNQAATEMQIKLSKLNNATKTLDFNGKMHIKQAGNKISVTLEDELKLIGNYRACQAFLMEQIKSKDALLTAAKNSKPEFVAVAPEHPDLQNFTHVPQVTDQWGWDQLSKAELAEYWDAEAQASVIGQFIHKGGTLDRLRRELPNLEPLEWFVAPGHEGKAHPITVTIHHTEQELWDNHQRLANLHRDLEQRVNYFKAKVKNLVTLKNAEIHKGNADKMNEIATANEKLMDVYRGQLSLYHDAIKVEADKFEAEKLKTIKEISALRIEVDTRFQPVIDELVEKYDDEVDA